MPAIADIDGARHELRDRSSHRHRTRTDRGCRGTPARPGSPSGSRATAAASEPHIQHRSDGRWIQVSERKTANGGVVAIYADITDEAAEAELADLVELEWRAMPQTKPTAPSRASSPT